MSRPLPSAWAELAPPPPADHRTWDGAGLGRRGTLNISNLDLGDLGLFPDSPLGRPLCPPVRRAPRLSGQDGSGERAGLRRGCGPSGEQGFRAGEAGERGRALPADGFPQAPERLQSQQITLLSGGAKGRTPRLIHPGVTGG